MAKRAERRNLVDPLALGRRIRGARTLAGYESTAAATAAVADRLGIHVSDRTLYSVERGEQEATWELLVALVLVLEPPGGMRFFWPAIDAEHVSAFVEISTENEADAIERAANNAIANAQAQLAAGGE